MSDARAALWRSFIGEIDARGYVCQPQQNLVAGVTMEMFETELRGGGGSELRAKFQAIHSSSALAVNTFAPFKARPADLVLGGRRGFTDVAFERKLRTIGRTKANLDVWLETETGVVAIESKLLEYFSAKTAHFSESYTRAALPNAEECWLQVFEEAKAAGRRLLDVAQVTKHYFALSHLRSGQAPGYYTLLYLFWEPTNADDFEACRKHRAELKALADSVQSSTIAFRWMTYSELWQQWSAIPALAEHAASLRARYEVSG